VSGSFSAGPWLHEVEFKIEQFSLSITFSDESTVKIGLGFLVSPGSFTEDTPGADTYVIPVYERIVIELWGAGAAGAAYVYGLPAAADLGDDGEDSTLSVDAINVVAGGGKRADFYHSGYETMTVLRFTGGEGGEASGGHDNIDGGRGEQGRFLTRPFPEFGTKGGDSPNGGAGGPRGAGISNGYGGKLHVGQDGSAPGGGGGGAGLGGQAGPPIGADFVYNRSFGAGGAGAYVRLVFDYMDAGAPEIGSTINFGIGAGGTGPAGEIINGNNLDGGDGAAGRFKITIGLTPPPPDPDGGQGTAIITGPASPRVGDTLTAVYGEDDPDGGETAILYQWTRDGTPIPFATNEEYDTVPADEGADIGVAITYTDALGYTETVEADEVGPVLPEARPLDDLLDGLFAAYSHRLLVSTYTGPLLRLRASKLTNSNDGMQQSGAPANSGNYIRFDFGTARLITGYHIPQNTYTATTGNGVFQWQGSDDASSWTNIGSNFNWNVQGTPDETQLNANATPYRYYQLLGVSGNLPNNLIWEFEFEIDDNGETERIGAPGGQSFQNPGGEGPRSSMITVTTTYSVGNAVAQRLVNGNYPDARKSFWPDYTTGELVLSEIQDWALYQEPIFSGCNVDTIFDQGPNALHLADFNTSAQMPQICDDNAVMYTTPNGRLASRSNSNQMFRHLAMPKPDDVMYFLEVIQRDNERPIRHFNWAYANVMTFHQPTSTANDWLDNGAGLHGYGMGTGAAPVATTADTYATTDDDAIVWEGGLNASRVGIRRDGTPQALNVGLTGYTNEAGTQTFTWPFPEATSDRDIRVCELVIWEKDVGYEDAEALALYRLNAMLAWKDEMPEPELYVVFVDDAELDAELAVTVVGPTLAVEFYDDAYMSAVIDGIDFTFSISFSDESDMSAVLALEVYPPNVQTVIVVLGW
jgi:hypothetical protein